MNLERERDRERDGKVEKGMKRGRRSGIYLEGEREREIAWS